MYWYIFINLFNDKYDIICMNHTNKDNPVSVQNS